MVREHRWDETDYDYDDGVVISEVSRGKMPVGSEAKAKAAAKTTYRSRRAAKRVSRRGGGIRNRRNKRLD